MPTITDLQLAKDLKNDVLAKVYFLYGEEQLMLERSVSAIIKKAVDPSMQSFNLQTFNGDEIDFDDLENAVEALPVFAERKCVVVHDLNIEKLPADLIDRLKELVKDPPETTVLLFYMTGIEVNLKGMKKVSSFIKQVEKVGTVVDFSVKTKAEISRALISGANKRGCYMSSREAEYLMELCGENLRVLMIELEKLCNFANGSDITVSMIDTLVCKTMEASVFELSKAILAKNADKAFTILSELFYNGEEPIAILGVLNSSFIALYRAKCAMLASKKVNDVLESFNYKGKEFILKNAFRDCAKIQSSSLDKCIELLADADIRLKSTKCDGQIAVEKLVASIIAQLEV